MIEIKETSRELTKVEKYLMTQSPEIQTLQDIEDGSVINVTAFCRFEDIKEDSGEVVDLLSILGEDNDSYVTQSATFIRSFMDIAKLFEDGEIIPVKKISGTTKNGRPYVNCVLDTASLK